MQQKGTFYDRIRRRFYLWIFLCLSAGLFFGALCFRFRADDSFLNSSFLQQLIGLSVRRQIGDLILISCLPVLLTCLLSSLELAPVLLGLLYFTLGFFFSLLICPSFYYSGRQGIEVVLLLTLPLLFLQLPVSCTLAFRIHFSEVSLKNCLPFRVLCFLSLFMVLVSFLYQAFFLPVLIARLQI